MNMRKWLVVVQVIILPALVTLVLFTGLTYAQGREPDVPGSPQNPAGPTANLFDQIAIQGRLTDASGNPLNGTHTVVFSIYDAPSGGTPLCGNLLTSINVINGLFNHTLDLCSTLDAFEGKQVYLGVKVGSDPEMTPRQPIYPVPYANTIRAGAVISGDIKQVLTGDGLVKAGVYANCGTGPGITTRAFNNTSNSIFVVSGTAVGRCTIDFNFNIFDRYYVVTSAASTARFVSCYTAIGQPDELYCRNWDAAGVAQDASIMVLVY